MAILLLSFLQTFRRRSTAVSFWKLHIQGLSALLGSDSGNCCLTVSVLMSVALSGDRLERRYGAQFFRHVLIPSLAGHASLSFVLWVGFGVKRTD